MVRGEDGKWRAMANEALYRRQKLIGMVYRSELAQGLARLGYEIEKSHADGRFEIAGVPRNVIEAYSTRRAEIEAAVAERGAGATANNQRLAERAALKTRAHKRDIDKAALQESWQRQAAELGFDARALAADALSREAVFSRADLLAAFAKTVLVVDEGSLASTVHARDLLRIANVLRIPRVVLVGDAKQLDAVDAGKPFAQLQQAGMKTAIVDEIMRQRDPELKAAVEASLAGEIGKAFDKIGANVAEVKADNIAGAVAARWLALSPEMRDRTGVMAPIHPLREGINGHVRERLAREGRIHGPALQSERMVSKGYTNAEKALAGNYTAGDVVAFHRPYRRIGVEKGDERRVAGVDHERREVLLDGGGDGTVRWKSGEIAGRRGGSEVYRAEAIELRAGDPVRWTRNDKGLGLVNSHTAEVVAVGGGRVSFRLEDGLTPSLNEGDPQLHHLDHAWASTVHAFQGRTVDNVIAATEANHLHLTTQKSFYVEISRPRDRAELVTDDAKALCEQLEAVIGERLSALEGIDTTKRWAHEKEQEALPAGEREPQRGMETGGGKDTASATNAHEVPEPDRKRVKDMDEAVCPCRTPLALTHNMRGLQRNHLMSESLNVFDGAVSFRESYPDRSLRRFQFGARILASRSEDHEARFLCVRLDGDSSKTLKLLQSRQVAPGVVDDQVQSRFNRTVRNSPRPRELNNFRLASSGQPEQCVHF